ncbi:MAG TPA: M20/M25/M40 family metallo-hydrolase [Candidatus Aquilonibacter sp.]|jgi:acetylornithine deacetylase/succinyl-diaminopimelate desuccinylase-like protein|nr:M20/M25/M40 family metallo-hydrolase [Candidatus Aquilonibacter sp.]
MEWEIKRLLPVAGQIHSRQVIRAILLVTVLGTMTSSFCEIATPLEEPAPGMASSHIPADHLQRYSDLALAWMQQYLRIDTTNPPGHEMRAVSFYKQILDQEGIENRAFEYTPERGDLWARLPHTTTEAKKPIILLNHMDVVTSDAAHWKVPPFSGEIKSGWLWGRGAQDMKDEGLAQLVVMVMLKREKVELDRDVIFLAVADEEADGTGTDWFIAHQRDLLGNAEFLINEGGENLLENGRVKYVGVDVGEKTTFWLHVVAHGRPGHASRPIPDSAPNRLIHALNRILAYQTPLKVLPVVEEFLREMAPYEPPEEAREYRNIRKEVEDKKFQQEVAKDESLNFLLRDTISLTMMGGSEQTNVIPPEAWANLDVRILPGGDPKDLMEQIRKVVNDPNVTVEPLNAEFREANYSPTNTALYEAIRKVSAKYFPGTPVVPHITSGYTENQRYRPLGIQAYGFNPYAATEEEGNTEHGNDERIRVEEVRRGPRILFDVVTSVAGEK